MLCRLRTKPLNSCNATGCPPAKKEDRSTPELFELPNELPRLYTMNCTVRICCDTEITKPQMTSLEAPARSCASSHDPLLSCSSQGCLGKVWDLPRKGSSQRRLLCGLHVSLLLSPLPPGKRTGKVSALEACTASRRETTPSTPPASALTPFSELSCTGEHASPLTPREFQILINNRNNSTLPIPSLGSEISHNRPPPVRKQAFPFLLPNPRSSALAQAVSPGGRISLNLGNDLSSHISHLCRGARHRGGWAGSPALF